jgi:serine/threonine protein kinase
MTLSRRFPALVPSFLSREEEAILRRYAKKINPRVGVLSVEGLGRYGNTGSRLFLVYFDQKKRGIPFVVKINDALEIEQEYSSIVEVQSYFSDALSGFSPEYYKGLGAITYKHWGGRALARGSSSIELQGLAFDFEGDPELALRVLGNIYSDCCRSAHEAASSKTVMLGEEYHRYLRKDLSRPKIEVVLGRRVSELQFEFMGTEVLNPIFMIEKLTKAKHRLRIGPIHGDLHPKNVVVDERNVPHLIDFAWARRGHVLKDFALMENSLRFFLFPRWCDLDMQAMVDRCLLEERGFAELERLAMACGHLSDYYIRLARMIGIIRSAAREVAGPHYSFEEYLMAQALVLYGLLRYDNYNIHTGVRALGLIAGLLERA